MSEFIDENKQFDSIVEGFNSPYFDQAEHFNIDALARIGSLGFVFDIFDESDNTVVYDIIPNTPAQQLIRLLRADTNMSQEEKDETKSRFIKDARSEKDDYLKKQWPELF